MTREQEQWLEAAIEAARAAAAELQSWRRRFGVRAKSDFNLVTDADLASQRAVQECLRARFADHAFLAEEQGSARVPAREASPTWIVDPLDGTTNYVHDCPGYCVSIGLEVQERLVVGVVLDPVRQELFSAVAGGGAWLGAKRLQVSGVTRLQDALVAMESPYDALARARNTDEWRRLSLCTQAMRQLGSTALDLAYIAAGRLDAYWGPRENHPWDIAAGAVLVREAGGRITNVGEPRLDAYRDDIIASNGALHDAILQAATQGGDKPYGS